MIQSRPSHDGRLSLLSNFCDTVPPVTVGGFPCSSGIIFFSPDPHREGVIGMITWTELFAFGMFIIALISLIVQSIDNKKK